MSQSNPSHSPIPAPTPAPAAGPIGAPANTAATVSQPPPTAVPAPVQTVTPTTSGIPVGSSIAAARPSGPNADHGSTSPSATTPSAASQPPQTTTPASSTGSPGPSSAASQTPQTTTPASSAGSSGPSSAATAAQSRRQAQSSNTSVKKKLILSKLWALKTLFYALIVIGITDALTLTSSSPRSPLGSISYSNGVLVLSILSMLTTYSLVVASKTAWDRVRFLLLSKRGDHGQNLLVFWTLFIDIGGSFLILWREFRHLFHSGTRQGNSSVAPHPVASREHPKLWSILRIISWAVMQFPGVVIMTIINSTTSYVPVQWEAISGGLGIYDPSLPASDEDPIRFTNYVLNILQDTRNAVQVPAINTDCIKANDSCNSYLLPGGLNAITPFPNRNINDTSLDVYITRGEPVYQLDFWKPPNNFTFPADGCNIYASTEDTGFQLCASPYGGESGQIVAGWTPCTDTILPSGDCNQTGSWNANIHFSTVLCIYRRTATITMRRNTGLIVAWSNLSDPKIQNITPSEFKSAFDVMLLPWSNSTSVINPLEYIWLLTSQIATTLSVDLDGGATATPYNLLYNLFATALYVYNPIIFDGEPSPSEVTPGLPHENYINGTYGRTRIHAVPQRWTVLTYVAVSGFLLLAVFITIATTAGYKGPEASEFPFVDLLNLRWFNGNGEVENIREMFGDFELAENDILERAADVKVKLRIDSRGSGIHP